MPIPLTYERLGEAIAALPLDEQRQTSVVFTDKHEHITPITELKAIQHGGNPVRHIILLTGKEPTTKEQFMTKITPKFSVGAAVKHTASHDASFPEGTGKVTEVLMSNTGDTYTYRIRCDETNTILPVSFKESELNPV